MKVSERITSSSALIDFSRPTKSGTIICGNTTISRSGRTAKTPSPEALDILAIVQPFMSRTLILANRESHINDRGSFRLPPFVTGVLQHRIRRLGLLLLGGCVRGKDQGLTRSLGPVPSHAFPPFTAKRRHTGAVP